MADTNTVSVTGKFDLKTISIIAAVLFGIGGLSIGGFTISQVSNIPTSTKVDSSTVQIVDAITLLSHRLSIYEREMVRISNSVEENQQSIQAMTEAQSKSDSLQIQGFKVLWEESQLNRQVLREMNGKIDTLKNPFGHF